MPLGVETGHMQAWAQAGVHVLGDTLGLQLQTRMPLLGGHCSVRCAKQRQACLGCVCSFGGMLVVLSRTGCNRLYAMP